MATSFIVSFNVIGIILSFLLPNCYFDSEINSEKDFKDQFRSYTIAGAIITLCCCFPTILLMKSKPDIPPSVSQQHQQDYNFSLTQSVKKLLNNKSFVYLLCSFSCTNGFYYFYPVIINDYLMNYKNISNFTTSLLIITSCIGGLVGSVILSIFVDKKRIYKLPLLILSLIIISIFIFITFFMEFFKLGEDNKKMFTTILLLAFASYGFCLIPQYSIAMDFACELTYPVGESASSGLMFTFSHILGLLSNLLIDVFLQHFNDYKFLPNLYSIMLFMISLVFIWPIKDNLVRKKEDENKKLITAGALQQNFNYF